ncbi:MAG: FKBP-type peptidyl-prolyl cis-trans isomerase [Gammaproteobacteria bacterium]|nr:FKBP-type peptidyl-prolyl cis-trans isomerase [Gammaproteobacteria bacterium]
MTDSNKTPPVLGIAFIALVIVAGIAWFATQNASSPAEEHAARVADLLDAPSSDTTELADGIRYVVIEPSDKEPVTDDYVEFNATVWTQGGVEVMSSEKDGNYVLPYSAIRQMAPGLAEAIANAPVGEDRRYYIRADLIADGIPGAPKEDMVVDLRVIGGKNPLPAPDSVASIPSTATVTESGLAYLVLEESGNDNSPTLADEVTVHYTGWTTDGKMFDSSVMRGEPTTFPLGRLIKGWQEGIPLMNVGDRYRFWIPAELAYGNNPRPGAPSGLLVFDIELLGIGPERTAELDGSDSSE